METTVVVVAEFEAEDGTDMVTYNEVRGRVVLDTVTVTAAEFYGHDHDPAD